MSLVGSGNTEQLLVATSGGSLVSFEVDTEANRIVEMVCVFLQEFHLAGILLATTGLTPGLLMCAESLQFRE